MWLERWNTGLCTIRECYGEIFLFDLQAQLDQDTLDLAKSQEEDKIQTIE